MPMKYLTTFIDLPPGVPSAEVVREFFRLAFAEFHWFKPTRFGRASLDGGLDPSHIDYDALLAYYAEYKNITVSARTDRDFFLLYPSRSTEWPYTGRLTWETSVAEARKSSWRAAHLTQVAEVMRLFGAPLAYSGPAEDCERKMNRCVPHPDGFGQTLTHTVRDYSEGLAGLFWRNVFGPPFVRLFGERLATLPEDARTDLGGGLVLVQPYALPTEAGTPAGEARERELITHLGPECFYEPTRHLKPTRRPDLPRPSVPVER
jgi:hypothetical protein